MALVLYSVLFAPKSLTHHNSEQECGPKIILSLGQKCTSHPHTPLPNTTTTATTTTPPPSPPSSNNLVSWCFEPSQPQRIISGLTIRENNNKQTTTTTTKKEIYTTVHSTTKCQTHFIAISSASQNVITRCRTQLKQSLVGGNRPRGKFVPVQQALHQTTPQTLHQRRFDCHAV